MPARGFFFDFAAWRYEGDMSSCRGAIARCALVRLAEAAHSRLLWAGVVRGKYKIAGRWSSQASYDRRRHRNCFPIQPGQAFPKK